MGDAVFVCYTFTTDSSFFNSSFESLEAIFSGVFDFSSWFLAGGGDCLLMALR